MPTSQETYNQELLYIVCASVREDTLRALASGLSPVQREIKQ